MESGCARWAGPSPPRLPRVPGLRFEAGITDAGLGLFNDFFLVAMGVCLVAIVSAAFMFFRKPGRQPP